MFSLLQQAATGELEQFPSIHQTTQMRKWDLTRIYSTSTKQTTKGTETREDCSQLMMARRDQLQNRIKCSSAAKARAKETPPFHSFLERGFGAHPKVIFENDKNDVLDGRKALNPFILRENEAGFVQLNRFFHFLSIAEGHNPSVLLPR